MKRLSPYCLAFALILTPVHVFAQDGGLGRVAPFVNDDTVAIVRVDLQRADIPAAVQWLMERLPNELLPQANLGGAADKGEAVRTALIENGVSEAFIVLGPLELRKFDDSFFIVLPVMEGKNPRDVIDAIAKIAGNPPGPGAPPIVHNSIVLGPPSRLQGIQQVTSAPRPDLAKALAAFQGATIQIAAALHEDMHRVLAESLDTLPSELGGGSGADLAAGLQWLAIGIDVPPSLAVQVTVQARDAESAGKVRATLSAAMDLLVSNEAITTKFPPLKTVLPMLLPESKGDQLVLLLSERNGKLEAIMDQLLLPAAATASEAARRAQSMNNLKQILLAMHNYHEVYRHFPAAYGRKKDGTRLLSWRVYLLPFLEQNPLYQEFHLDEPWDSDHNKTLISKMPKLFASPSLPVELAERGMASYVAPVGEKTIWEGDEGTFIGKITDGTSATIAILEADAEHAVIWTKPDDLKIDWNEPKKGLLFWGKAPSAFMAALCDGSVRAISENIDPAMMKRLLQKNDGEPVGEIP